MTAVQIALPASVDVARTKVWQTLLACLLVALVAVVAYWPGLTGPFVFDDYPNIVTNAKVHADQLDADSLRRAAGAYSSAGTGRALATVSFALNYHFSGTSPWGYKATSLAVHVFNALLVYAVLLNLVRLPRLRSTHGSWFCLAIALLWAAHPLQVSTVLYVVQRMEMMSLTFVLAGLATYISGRNRQIQGIPGGMWRVIASVPIAALGLLAKETAALFPLYTLALELSVLGFAANDVRLRRFYRWGYALGAGIGLTLFCVFLLPSAWTQELYDGRAFGPYERVLTQFRVLPMYIGQILLPVPSHLLFYYDSLRASAGWLSPITTLLGLLLVSGLLVSAWWARRRLPLLTLGILWFFAAHAITSNVLNLELAFEHRNYFAMLGVLLAVGELVNRIRLRDGQRLKYFAVSIIVVASVFLTLIRSATWGHELLFFNDLVEVNRESPRAGNDLASLLVAMANGDANSPFYSLGKRHFERTAALPNSSPLAEQGLILMAAVHRQPAEQAWWDSLVEKVRTRPLSPEEYLAVSGLLQQRRQGLAMDDVQLTRACQALLARNPSEPALYAWFGDYALNQLHDEALAEKAFVAAIEHSRNDPSFAQQVLTQLLTEGRTRQADKVLERGRQLGLFPGASPPSQTAGSAH